MVELCLGVYQYVNFFQAKDFYPQNIILKELISTVSSYNDIMFMYMKSMIY